MQKIYSNKVWVADSLQPATVSFSNGKIISVEFEKPANTTDFGDAIIMPGCIDAHVHVNEPGRTNWEGFDTATQAAAAGGITTIVDMPLNASPVTTTVDALEEKLKSTQGKLHVNTGFYAGVVPGNEDQIEKLCQAGVLGIKAFLTHSGIDEFPNVGKQELERIMPVLKEFGKPLLVHCELTDNKHASALEQSPTGYMAYLQSRPNKWEEDAVAMMIELCRKHGCKTHIVHVASATALKLIENAKKEGLPITAETCPHYLFFNAEEIPDANTLYKCAPPIREKANNAVLKNAYRLGILDFIASDHSPAPPGIKELETGDFLKAWGGIAGLQFLLSASWTSLKEQLSLSEFIPYLTARPAAFLGLDNKGTIAEGKDADMLIWQPEESFMAEEKDIFHKHKASPYTGKKLYGKVLTTIVNGNIVYQNNEIIHKNCGTWLLKK
ncbi:MAG: allantoinase AllB [Ferruginibacter sp.]